MTVSRQRKHYAVQSTTFQLLSQRETLALAHRLSKGILPMIVSRQRQNHAVQFKKFQLFQGVVSIPKNIDNFKIPVYLRKK